MRLTAVAGFVILAALTIASADSSSVIADKLNQQLRGEIITLRQSDAAEELRFNRLGERIGRADAGLWARDSMLKLESVSLKKNHLRLDAKRVILTFDRNAGEFVRTPTNNGVRIDIEVPNTTIEFVNNALGKVFIHSPETLADVAPDYWSACFRGAVVRKQFPDHSDWRCEDSTARSLPTDADLDPKEFRGFGLVYTVGRKDTGTGILAPKPLSIPEPAYPEIARQAKYQGTTILWLIIDRDGIPKNIRVIRPLGLALDDAAVHAVEKWRFQPAMKGSEPVPVQINVEVNFRLY